MTGYVKSSKSSSLLLNRVRLGVIYTLLSIWALIVIFPFYFMILTSVKSYGSYNAEFIPKLFTLTPTLENYLSAFSEIQLGKYLLNTLIFTVGTTVIMLIVTVLAAFAFARINFKGQTCRH